MKITERLRATRGHQSGKGTRNQRRTLPGPVADAKKNEQGERRLPPRLRSVLGFAGRTLLMLAVLGIVVFGGVAVFRHATTSPYFAVGSIEVKGTKRLSGAEVLQAAGLARGINIFSVDGARIKGMLEEQPWIAEAEVRRRLPRSLTVEITEREAAAVVLFDVPYLVDDGGEVFKRWMRGDPTPAPILTGFTREQFLGDPEDVRGAIRDGIDLAARYREVGLEKTAPLAEIHFEESGEVSLAVAKEGVYVRLGRAPFRAKMTRLAELMPRLRRDGQHPAMIFFDNEVRSDRVTVKLKPLPDEDPAFVAPNIARDDKKTLSKI